MENELKMMNNKIKNRKNDSFKKKWYLCISKILVFIKRSQRENI